ncbi:MAG: isoaspartyl peptidase/L-asparaginase [Chitinophagales bacterium]|nr:isoaspartyl peptidase/L-asparaginase [Chitinophagales bacterium]
MKKFGIAVHGGAGVMSKRKLTPEREKIYRDGLEEALNFGYQILEKGGSSLDAVEAAVQSLEDFPLFNAGKGAVFNHDGKHEMDASIMEGKDLFAGAVTGIKNIKNPVTLAKAIMQQSDLVFLSGDGAEKFAQEYKIEFADDEYFFSQERFDQLQRALKKSVVTLDDGADKKFSTVGAVALDNKGNLAAATSTGGLTNKRFGRIGDSPMIGAGTYANNKTCAVSCTGHGEYFIRAVVAYDIHALMDYKGMLLKEAVDFVVKKKLVDFNAEGGLIAIDKFGNIEMPFNSEGMYRACRRNGDETLVAIY